MNKLLSNINPMDWHNTKFLDHIPKHFAKVRFQHNDERTRVMEWLLENASGRFGIESESTTTNGDAFGNIWNEDKYIGFENPADATMYTMFFK